MLVGVGLTQSTICPMQQVNNAYMVMSPLWHELGNIHGFVPDGKSYRQGWATAQTPNGPAISSVRVTTPALCTCNLTTFAWSLVIDYVKWPGALLEQLSSWR